jgi:hypothetical protein
MKKSLFTCAFLSLTAYSFLISQNSTALTCNAGQYMFSAKVVNNLGLIYTVTDVRNQKTDTMLISYSTAKTCFCNDTLAVFLTEHGDIEYFRLNKDGWKWGKAIHLPEQDLLVGILKEGKEYETSSHTLVSTHKIVSELYIRQCNNQKLIPLKKYSIEYRIDTENGVLLVDKKVLQDE